MDILIRDMEMPPVGRILIVLPSGRTLEVSADETQNIFREAQAVPVPPHGRCIDANKIGLTDFEIILCQKGNPYKNALEMLFEKIENAPTIIPASKEDE